MYPTTFSGADLSALVREASTAALKEFMSNRDKEDESCPSTTLGPPSVSPDQHPHGGVGSVCIQSSHIEVAFRKVKPSVSERVSLYF